MNANALAALPVRDATRFRTPIAALACALVLPAILAACGSAPTGAASLACPDKVAKATTTTSPVVGLWDCLTPAFQNKLKEVGAAANTALDGVLSIGVATTTRLIGANSDFATYELLLNPGTAQQAGVKTVEITVWLDPAGSGKVDNVGVGTPAF